MLGRHEKNAQATNVQTLYSRQPVTPQSNTQETGTSLYEHCYISSTSTTSPTCGRRSLATRSIAEKWETAGGSEHRRRGSPEERRQLPKPLVPHPFDSPPSSLTLSVWEKTSIQRWGGGRIGSVVVSRSHLCSHTRFAKASFFASSFGVPSLLTTPAIPPHVQRV